MQFSAITCCVRLFSLGVGLVCILTMIPSRGVGQQIPQPLPTIPLAPTNAKQEPKDKEPAKANGEKDKSAESAPEFTLGQCIAIALERSPDLRALISTEKATAASSKALNDIGTIGSILAPDLPIRKEQAARGLIAAAADIQKKRNEIVQDVTRLYYTVVYARQQEAIADDMVAQLEALVDIAKRLLKAAAPNITQAMIDGMEIGLGEARSLRVTARMGSRQAMAGLRQLMAVTEQEFPFRVKDVELPVIGTRIPLAKQVVIDRALACRPEMSLAAAGVDAFRLEVYAQARIPCRQTVRTFASGSDIHARQVPQGSRDKDYRPEAMAPEMPPQLVGSKIDRVCRAMAYCERAEAVYETTQNLIALEAEIAYHALDAASQKLEIAKDKFKSGKSLMERTRENFDNPDIPKERLVTAYIAASKAQSDYVEAVYQHLLALAALERVTAGGIRAPFPNR